MEELNYFWEDIDNVSLNSKIVLMTDIIEFSKYIRANGIKNIFFSEYSEKFISTNKIEPKYKGSIIFYAFDCNKVLMLWTDSWGYDTIECYEESSENGIFYTINRLKNEYSNEDVWNQSTGLIYQLLRSLGYKSSKVVEYSVRFFQGKLFRYEIYNKVRKVARKGRFENITQLIISSKAAFEDVNDYYAAMEVKAPDMKTLSSMRLIEEIELKYKFENHTSALLFTVMLKMKKLMKGDNGEEKRSLHEIRRELEKYLPKNVYEGFRKVESDKDIIDMIQNEYGFSMIGFLNENNKYFYFSRLKIYIDASNIIHNGQRKRGENKNTNKPTIEFLKECVSSLEELEIKVTGIYLDYSKEESLMLENREQKNEFQKLKQELEKKRILVTVTMKGEIADDRLIRKLKDDQGCYVISNDRYKEYNLSDSQSRRLINFERMSDGKYRFSMGFYENKEIELRGFIADTEKDLEKYENVMSLNNLGTWRYPKIYEYFQIEEFLNEHLKNI